MELLKSVKYRCCVYDGLRGVSLPKINVPEIGQFYQVQKKRILNPPFGPYISFTTSNNSRKSIVGSESKHWHIARGAIDTNGSLFSLSMAYLRSWSLEKAASLEDRLSQRKRSLTWNCHRSTKRMSFASRNGWSAERLSWLSFLSCPLQWFKGLFSFLHPAAKDKSINR